MTEKIRQIWFYLLDRLGEQSTWQGIGFFVALMYGKQFAGFEWGEAAALGGMVSGVLKIIFPDKK